MSSDTPKMYSLMEPSRKDSQWGLHGGHIIYHRGLVGASSPVMLLFLFCRRAAPIGTVPTLAAMPNSSPGVFNPAHLGKVLPHYPFSGMFWASNPLSNLFCLLAQGTKAGILQSDWFIKATMIHSKFYNCSCSLSYKIYRCGPDPSPFKWMLGNTNPNLRALKSKDELH